MKFKNIAMAISASTVLLATSAFAQDGQINFTGDITAATCVVATGTQGVQNIDLGKVSLQSLSSAGQTSAATEFNIALTGCTANSKAVIKFDGTQVAGNNALLANTGTAGNVGVGIYESDSITPVKLRAATKEITTNQAGEGQFNFVAKYVSTGAATAGSVVASTTFSIVYN